MHISAQLSVVSQIPARMIGVVINNNFITAPVPAVAVTSIIGSDAEEESAKAEPVRSAAVQMPRVAATNAAGKTAVFPRMMKMVVRVVSACIVAHPLAIIVHSTCGASGWPFES